MAALRPFAFIGRTVLDWVDHLGAAAIFLGMALQHVFRRKQFAKTVRQIYYIGARSITIMLVAACLPMVFGLQAYHALSKFGAQGAVGSLVALSLIMELGSGADRHHDHGASRFSHCRRDRHRAHQRQIDALQTIGINPMRYIVSPRISASIISFPLLTAVFDLIGILGGYISAVLLFGAEFEVFTGTARRRTWFWKTSPTALSSRSCLQ